MIIVRSFCECVEELFESNRLPSVEELRPSSCPLCGELAFSPGKPLGIVGGEASAMTMSSCKPGGALEETLRRALV